jgi:hypothetical protein
MREAMSGFWRSARRPREAQAQARQGLHHHGWRWHAAGAAARVRWLRRARRSTERSAHPTLWVAQRPPPTATLPAHKMMEQQIQLNEPTRKEGAGKSSASTAPRPAVALVGLAALVALIVTMVQLHSNDGKLEHVQTELRQVHADLVDVKAGLATAQAHKLSASTASAISRSISTAILPR